VFTTAAFIPPFCFTLGAVVAVAVVPSAAPAGARSLSWSCRCAASLLLLLQVLLLTLAGAAMVLLVMPAAASSCCSCCCS
jgi:hypothetical protein